MTTLKTILIAAGATVAFSAAAFATVTATNLTKDPYNAASVTGALQWQGLIPGRHLVAAPDGGATAFAGHDTATPGGASLTVTHDSGHLSDVAE